MCLWDEDLVNDVMDTERFLKHLEKRVSRVKSARKAVETRINNTLQMIDSKILEIKVEKLDISDNELRERAIQNTRYYRDRYYYLDENPYYDYADNETVDRWVVNYIRHCLTNYDIELYNLKGRTGKEEAYCKYKNAVLSEIANVYPKYKDECEDQKYYISY